MNRVNMKYFILLFCMILFGLISVAWAQECRFNCNLSCNQVGPKPAATNADGAISFQLDESRQELSYKLEVENINDVYMAHIHIGPDNKQGPIVAWLYPFNDHGAEGRCIDGEFSGILSEGVIRPEDLKEGVTFNELIEAMRSGQAYVNVHTKNYIPGEIRGQIHAGI